MASANYPGSVAVHWRFHASFAAMLIALALPPREYGASCFGALLALGLWWKAVARLGFGLTLVEPDGAFDECEMFIRLTHARACRLRGDMEAAKSIALAACDRLDRLAKKIQDPSLRASFVGSVPEHTRILKLAGRAAPPSRPGH